MRGRFGLSAAVAVALCSLVVAACGGGGDSGGGGGGGGGGAASGGGGKTTSGAKVIDPNSANGAKGTVTYCQGKDTAGNAHAWEGVQRQEHRHHREAARVPGLCRRAAPAVHPASAGEV